MIGAFLGTRLGLAVSALLVAFAALVGMRAYFQAEGRQQAADAVLEAEVETSERIRDAEANRPDTADAAREFLRNRN